MLICLGGYDTKARCILRQAPHFSPLVASPSQPLCLGQERSFNPYTVFLHQFSF